MNRNEAIEKAKEITGLLNEVEQLFDYTVKCDCVLIYRINKVGLSNSILKIGFDTPKTFNEAFVEMSEYLKRLIAEELSCEFKIDIDRRKRVIAVLDLSEDGDLEVFKYDTEGEENE